MSTSLEQLKQRVLERTDMENSNFISTSELTNYINVSLQTLGDLIISYGEDLIYDAYEIDVVADTAQYDLPEDMYKLLNVNITSSGRLYELKRMNLSDNVKLQDYTFGATGNYGFIGYYRLLGNSIHLFPTPKQAYTLTLHFVPELATLVNNNDLVHSSIVKSWLQYVVINASIMILNKEESDTSILQGELQRQQQIILRSMPKRDAGSPAKVVEKGNFNAPSYLDGES